MRIALLLALVVAAVLAVEPAFASEAAEGHEHAGPDWAYLAYHTLGLALLLGVIVYYTREPLQNFLLDRSDGIRRQIEGSGGGARDRARGSRGASRAARARERGERGLRPRRGRAGRGGAGARAGTRAPSRGADSRGVEALGGSGNRARPTRAAGRGRAARHEHRRGDPAPGHHPRRRSAPRRRVRRADRETRVIGGAEIARRYARAVFGLGDDAAAPARSCSRRSTRSSARSPATPSSRASCGRRSTRARSARRC